MYLQPEMRDFLHVLFPARYIQLLDSGFYSKYSFSGISEFIVHKACRSSHHTINKEHKGLPHAGSDELIRAVFTQYQGLLLKGFPVAFAIQYKLWSTSYQFREAVPPREAF